MPIKPLPPVEGPINFNTDSSDNYTVPIHLMRDYEPIELNSHALPPDIEIDTTFNPAEILANHEPIHMAMPALLGLRKLLATRRIERANKRVPELERRRRVALYVGRSLLLNKSYNHHYNPDGTPNLNRPLTRHDKKVELKLDSIKQGRRNEVGHQHALARPHTEVGQRDYAATEHIKDMGAIDMPPSPTRAEAKHVRKSRRRYNHLSHHIRDSDKEYRSVIGKPSKQAERAIKRRERDVVTVESIKRRQAANRLARQALKAKAASKARAGWTGTKAVTKTVGRKTHSGVVSASEGTKRVVKKAPGKAKQVAGAGLSKLRRK